MTNSMNRRRFLQRAAAATAGAGLLSAGAAGEALAHGRHGRHGHHRHRRRAADLVVYNGSVLVMDRRFQIAEAVAIRDGRILEVGRIRELRHLVDRRTEVINAKGGTVLPGINDSHLHLNGFGLSFPPFSIDVNKNSIPELVAVVQEAANNAPDGPGGTSFIRGGGWNETGPLGRPPTKEDLDPVSGNHPVVLRNFSFHSVAVNTKVLELAGITSTNPADPELQSFIVKGPDGEPNGVIRETAQGLVNAVIPPFTRDEVSGGIDTGISILHSQGITSITEPGIGLSTLDIYADKQRADELPMRVTALLTGGISPATVQQMLDAYEPIKGLDPLNLRVAGIKIFSDGIPTQAETAWLHEPYVDGTNGSMVILGSSDAEKVANLHEMIRRAHNAGFQIGIHATGDASIDAVVDGYLRAMRLRRRKEPRHYVIHGDLTPLGTLRKMARHRIGVNMNATIKYLLGRTLEPIIGPERTDYQWPYRSALDRGVRVSSGSDAPVTFPSWLQGINGAVLREGFFGGVAGEAERISVPEALHTYTSTPAWQDFAERAKGTLHEGKVGDLCILDEDVTEVDPHDLTKVPINATVIDGKVVYERPGSAIVKKTAAAARLQQSHGKRCYEGGICCCQLNDQIRAGGHSA